MLTSVELALVLAMACTVAGSLAFCRYAYQQPGIDRKSREPA